MKKGVNRVTLIGNLGNDPEIKFLTNGDAVCNLSIATSESWKDKSTGQPQERTEWHRVVFFRKPADIIAEYTKKGSKLYIEGSLQTRKWQDKDGIDRYTTEIRGDQFQFLDSKGDNQGQQASSIPKSSYDANQDNANNGLGQKVEHVANNFDNFDDDIPF